MTEQEKQLLIKVLCEMLPYKVMVNVKSRYEDKFEIVELNGYHIFEGSYNIEYRGMKPYLRPMESLTKEERIEIGKAIQKDRINPSGEIKEEGSDNLLLCTIRQSTNLLSWMNANHIDYHGLIPMGLALPAPEGMYK